MQIALALGAVAMVSTSAAGQSDSARKKDGHLAVAATDLLGVAGATVGPGLPAGWKVRPVRGQAAPSSLVRSGEDGRLLRVEGAGSAAWFHRELPVAIAEAPGSLRWSWRVLESPARADLRGRETDDSPIRVFVVFGTPRAFGGAGRIIFYSYGGREPVGFARRSSASARAHVISVDGRVDNGRWLDNAVDPFADYRRLWRQSPPAITAVGIMQDTDQTRAQAIAELRQLEWEPKS